MTEKIKSDLDVWVIEYNRIKQCTFVKKYETKTVVTFHGVPEVFDNNKIFETKADALDDLIQIKIKELANISQTITNLTTELGKQ